VSDETPSAHAFFEQYARARSTRDVDLIASQYADPFMLADPNGARVVQKASLLAVFPNGLQLLRIHGHTSTNLRSLSEDRLSSSKRVAQLIPVLDRPAWS
jgi:ketosteroid isomerase-like protein